MRVAIGSLLTVFLITVLATAAPWIIGPNNDLREATSYGMAIVSPIVATVCLVVWGLPVHFILSKYKMKEFWWYVIAGFIPAPIFVFVTKPLGADITIHLLMQSIYFGVFGCIGALIFWFYVVKKAS